MRTREALASRGDRHAMLGHLMVRGFSFRGVGDISSDLGDLDGSRVHVSIFIRA